jgi:hypothetical protein
LKVVTGPHVSPFAGGSQQTHDELAVNAGRDSERSGRRLRRRNTIVANSILEAVKMGLWHCLPHTVDYDELEASDAMPGTREKLDMLAEHLRRAVPVRHFDDSLDDDRRARENPADRQPRRRPR